MITAVEVPNPRGGGSGTGPWQSLKILLDYL